MSTTSEVIAKLVNDIASNRTHGASELARQALQNIIGIVTEHASLSEEEIRLLAIELAQRQAESRPSMAVLRNFMDEWLKEVRLSNKDNVENFAEAASASASRLLALSKNAGEQAAKHAATLLRPGMCVMTHSYSSSVHTLLTNTAPRPLECIVTQGEPGIEGLRLAKELSAADISYQYISDAQMGLFVQYADCVVVGADTLLIDGSLVNKAGTLLLALAANQYQVPLYVCCESFKRTQLRADEIKIESGPISEIDDQELVGRTVQNRTFDITPPSLIDTWITESGIIKNWVDAD